MDDTRLQGARAWESLVKDAATRWGVDYRLALSVMAQESAGDPTAISPAGAIGLMQLMPGTAAGLGVDPYDPVQNIEGGVRYLAEQMRRYGNTSEALAAYNAGPGNVDKYGGVPPYPETQDYVKAVGAYFDVQRSTWEKINKVPFGGTVPIPNELRGQPLTPEQSVAMGQSKAPDDASGTWKDVFTAKFWKTASVWIVLVLVGLGAVYIGIQALARGESTA